MRNTTHVFTLAAALAAVVALDACASTSVSNNGAAPPRPRLNSSLARGKSPGSSHDVVLADELRRVPATNLFTALERARPDFLRVRASTAAMRRQSPEIDVFLNGQYAGGAEVLRSIPSDFVTRIQLVQRSQGYVMHGPQLRGEHALFVTLVR